MPDTTPAPAGLPRRLAAIVYDTLLLAAILMAGAAVWVAGRSGAPVPAGDWAFRLYLLALAFGFFGGFWVLAGRTLGMQAWALRVTMADGSPVTWPAALSRFVTAMLSWALLGGGFLWALADRERLTLHDRLSGTRLVHSPRAPG